MPQPYLPRKGDWSPALPPPPAEFHQLVTAAKPLGYWIIAARHERERDRHGARYRITRPQSDFILYVSDDLQAIRAWLWESST